MSRQKEFCFYLLNQQLFLLSQNLLIHLFLYLVFLRFFIQSIFHLHQESKLIPQYVLIFLSFLLFNIILLIISK